MPNPTAPATEVPMAVTEAGPITLLELPALKMKLAELQTQSHTASDQARSLRELAANRLIDFGSSLLDSTEPIPAPLTGLVEQARSLRSRVSADDARLDALPSEAGHGVSGLIGKVGAWSKSRKVTNDRVALEAQLRSALLQIGQQAPGVAFEQANIFRQQSEAASGQAEDLEANSKSVEATVRILENEVKGREEAVREMGFDAPYLAAYLKTYGPQHLESPLNLKHGEHALAVLAARLARQKTRTRFVGGSQGFSFPIGHTRIRYRVGSYHGHPVQQQFLATLDSGSLVITDQRIAFIGPLKSTSVALAKLVHVQCYADALAVFQEGRENPDFYMLSSPKYALFMINWAEQQIAGVTQ